MGKSASEISQELDQARSDAAEKIEKIEQQVTQSAESVKESLDWRHQVEERPLMAIGAAFLGGFLLGEVGGGDDGQSSNGATTTSYSNQTGSSGGHRQRGGIGAAIRHAARESGAEDAFSSAAAAILTVTGQRVKAAVEESYPGFIEKYEVTKSAHGGVAERVKVASETDSQQAAGHMSA